jgi:predicted metal-binding membrane protein
MTGETTARAPGGAPWRGRLPMLAGLLGVAALAWLYLWYDAARMAAMDTMPGSGSMGMGMGMSTTGPAAVWRPLPFLLTFLMWAVMMVGMMLPSAAPAVLHYGALVRGNRERGRAMPSAWLFTAGYLAVWTVFSLAATVLQSALQAAAMVTPMMVSASVWLSGGLLVAAGIYQWLPLKDACLRTCRAPLQFFLFHWRPGARGAVRMGMEHGAICVGCCWALMLLLFVAGVMNLLWVALIAAFVLAEKLAPPRWPVARAAGAALVVAGIGLMVARG